MALYFTRVELHNASLLNYEVLHKAMEKMGFTRYALVYSGHKRRLPTAEYSLTGNFVDAQVLELAKKAASNTGLDFEVLVVNANSWTSENLPVLN